MRRANAQRTTGDVRRSAVREGGRIVVLGEEGSFRGR